MRRELLTAATGALVLVFAGCATGPLLDNPVLIRPTAEGPVENPVFLPQGPEAYNALFEMVLDVVSDYFEIRYSNRYDGRIVSFPKIAPGLGQLLKPGSPDPEQRLLATLQTIRLTGEVVIHPEPDGGFSVDVKVFRELEDLPRPTRAVSGNATFGDVTVQRQPEVIDLTTGPSRWIPLGRDCALEQLILERLSRWDRCEKPPPPPAAGP
jgi:hypothetical protein